ncbi:MAG: GyrI-like domain-containing protein [Oscillospiraceae bacterium]|nr:GyrI-like domain-containing protein [Oscillospiraceae bacterium]
MPFDFKKEYKELYVPKAVPQIVEVPPMNYVAIRGKGDPNKEESGYKEAIGLLYAISYTIKMSYKSPHTIEGYFEYVVPPLEGFWRQEGVDGVDYSNKNSFNWISVIRLPDFVTEEEFRLAVNETERKKKIDCSRAEFISVDEGLCVQIMHVGSYDSEPESVAKMDSFLAENGYENDFSEKRLHNEIYLSDPRKTAPEKCKTVIRHPIRKI